jgi:predicted XRE-type DNA-binding protein
MERTASPTVTAEMAAEIRKMKAEGLFTHQIAAHFGINQGRVSEVMNGQLHPETERTPTLFDD